METGASGLLFSRMDLRYHRMRKGRRTNIYFSKKQPQTDPLEKSPVQGKLRKKRVPKRNCRDSTGTDKTWGDERTRENVQLSVGSQSNFGVKKD